MEEYDPATDTWTSKAWMPTARILQCATAVNGKIYVIGGGEYYDSPPYPLVEIYHPTTDTWTAGPDMLTARKSFATSAVHGKIYAIGGSPSESWTDVSAIVEEYTPE